MLVTEQEIVEVKDFVTSLNCMKDGVVVVEGKRDAAALHKLGFSGNILEFHSCRGMTHFADAAAQYRRVIMLFDRDRKGRYLASRATRLLERRTKVDMSFKRRLCTITKGQIVFIEQLCFYVPYLA